MSWSDFQSGSPDSLDVLSPESTAFPWFGLRTKPNQEKAAASILLGKGYQPYLPVNIERRRRSDRTVIMERPLFPGYLFCRFNPVKRLPIITTTGIVSILSFGSEPVPIPDPEIEAVEVALRSGLPVRRCGFVQQGQRIRVNRGSLEGLEGIIVRVKNEFRLIISMNMLQRSISVEIDGDSVSAA